MKVYLGNKREVEINVEPEDEIMINPTCYSVGGVWDISAKNAYRVIYWKGIEHVMTYVYYAKSSTGKKRSKSYEAETKEEAKMIADKIYNDNNKNVVNKAFSVMGKDLNEAVMKKFRFQQEPIHYSEKPVPLDPYFIGLWLGDGTTARAEVTTVDEPIINYLQALGEKYEIPVSNRRIAYTFRTYFKGLKHANYIKDCMESLNLIGNKHIPKVYLENSSENRLKLLAGIIDSDGYKDSNVYEITQKVKSLAQDIRVLANSLGIFVTVRPKMACATNTEEKRMIEYQRIHLYPTGMSIPVLLNRKANSEPKNVHGIKISTQQQCARSEWTDEMRELLLKCAANAEFKKGSRVSWKAIWEKHEIFQKSTAECLRTMHQKIMKKQTTNNV